MNIQEKIKNWVKGALKIENDFVLVHPKDLKNGDYSFFHSTAGGNDLVKKLSEDKLPEIEKIEAVGNFINFYLSKEFFSQSVKKINKEREKCGENKLFKNQKIMVEFTDPNPFKEFHIGHLMSNSIGESIARIIEAEGAEINRANWQGDMGLQVAKAVWGIKNHLEGELNTKEPYKDLLSASNLGKAYARGAKAYEDKEKRKEIIEINKQIYDRSKEEINEIYDKGRQVSLDYFETIYKRLGTKFDHYFFESKEGVEGKSIVEAHIKDSVFEKSNGAIIFRGEKYGLHTRVFINSDGIPIYEAKELGLNKKKFDVEPDLNKSIIITGNEIREYFKVLLKVISLIFPDIAEKTLHISHGMLRLPTGKMASRTGDVITAESLINQVKEKILEKIVDRDFDTKEKEEIAEMIAIGAIKYSILRQAIGGDIIFNFDKSIALEGDSGPYLQYTAVRANSVLQKARAVKTDSRAVISERNSAEPAEESVLDVKISEHWETTELERYLYRFPETVERAGKEYAPHYIVTYLTELASIFNSFYAKEKIIDKNDPTSPYKIALTSATFNILKSGLNLLGIKVPGKM